MFTVDQKDKLITITGPTSQKALQIIRFFEHKGFRTKIVVKAY